MQNWIHKQQKNIMLASGLLIVLAFASKGLADQEALAQVLFFLASIIGGVTIFHQAIQALRLKMITIDLLVSLAILGAFGIREFEESAVVAFLFLLGAYLEKRTLAKTRSAIQGLVDLVPQTAYLLDGAGQVHEVPLDQVEVGDRILVKTGGRIPVDGIVLSGSGRANQASITGEALPVAKQVGDLVFAGSILENGTLQITAQKVGQDTTFGKIIELVEEAQDSKSQAERTIDRFASYYTPAVLVLALLVGFLTRKIDLAVTILVLGCPGALVIGVPVSNVAGIGQGAKEGILFKGSEVISQLSRVDTFLFDKTGTLTYGRPQVDQVHYYQDDTDRLASYLVAVEEESDHPLAKAILQHFGHQTKANVTDTQVVKGGGIKAQVEGHQVLVGNAWLMQEWQIPLTDEIQADLAQEEASGQSLVLMAIDGRIALLVAISDQVRAGVKEDLAQLKKLGVKNLILLSGDNQGTVDRVAKELGLTQAYGQLLPSQKADYVKAAKAKGQIVAFVGDGINDSPSLAHAHIGMAMGSGTDVAIENSNVVLMQSDMSRIPYAVSLAKSIRANMIENMAIALGVVGLLLVSVLSSSWMNMALGMLVHEGSILLVILNAMRLLRPKKIRKLDTNQLSYKEKSLS